MEDAAVVVEGASVVEEDSGVEVVPSPPRGGAAGSGEGGDEGVPGPLTGPVSVAFGACGPAVVPVAPAGGTEVVAGPPAGGTAVRVGYSPTPGMTSFCIGLLFWQAARAPNNTTPHIDGSHRVVVIARIRMLCGYFHQAISAVPPPAGDGIDQIEEEFRKNAVEYRVRDRRRSADCPEHVGPEEAGGRPQRTPLRTEMRCGRSWTTHRTPACGSGGI